MGNIARKIGITGAAGTIGEALHQGLAPFYDLTLFDLKKIASGAAGRCITIDFGDKTQLDGVFDGLDAVIHLAGDPRPNAPAKSTLRNNFVATSLVFEAARQAGVKKVVFASSNFYHEGDIALALQGKTASQITLGSNPTPRCLYGESKLFGEQAGRHISHFGVQFVALRIGWTVPEDNPVLYDGPYMRAVFCSKCDLVQAFSKALEVDADFLTAFAVSNNSRGIFDLEETRSRLGFIPQDNAEAYEKSAVDSIR